MHRSQRFKVWWESRKALLICGLLLELPLCFRVAPDPPTDETRPWSRMLNSDKTIAGLEQIFHTRDVESSKMVRGNRRLGNPDISQPWHTTLSLGKYRIHSTQGMSRSSIVSEAVRWKSIRLLHFLPSTKPRLAYKIHYELFLQLSLQSWQLLDLSPQVLLSQNLRSAGSQLLCVVHSEQSRNQIC